MTYAQVMGYFKNDIHAACSALNVSQSTIYNWKDGGIPLVRQQSIQTVTNGKLRAERVKILGPRGGKVKK